MVQISQPGPSVAPGTSLGVALTFLLGGQWGHLMS